MIMYCIPTNYAVCPSCYRQLHSSHNPVHQIIFSLYQITFTMGNANQRCERPHAKNEEKHCEIRVKCQNKLKIKEKAKILTQENFQKRGNQLKRGTLTPLVNAMLGMGNTQNVIIELLNSIVIFFLFFLLFCVFL